MMVDPNQLSYSKLNVIGQSIATLRRLIASGSTAGALDELNILRETIQNIRVVSSRLIDSGDGK